MDFQSPTPGVLCFDATQVEMTCGVSKPTPPTLSCGCRLALICLGPCNVHVLKIHCVLLRVFLV